MAVRKAAGQSELAGSQQTIEQLQERYNQLYKRKIETDTKFGETKKVLDTLKAQAREKYGTEDLAELQGILERMKRENEEKRANYQADLDRIENSLAEVERNFQTTEANAGKQLP